MTDAISIKSVAVLGAGTMGIGIAAHCADQGLSVRLLDLPGQAEKGIERLKTIRPPALDDPSHAARIVPGTFEHDLAAAGQCDWIVEAIVEDVGIKRALFQKLEAVRRDGSVVTSNTSGIPLRDIAQGMPARFRRDFAITHFFNPVKIMRLVELVPGDDTAPQTMARLQAICGTTLGKGVVKAKDTVNFIGNRIGCFWMLSGLHKAEAALAQGLAMETIDAAMGAPVGLPPTGLYGLIDLIGLDVMELVGRNLAQNLPAKDVGRAFAAFPPKVAAMHVRGQLGRKTGAGFYRQTASADGKRLRETFELTNETWRPAQAPAAVPGDVAALLFGADALGRLAFDLMGGTLAYAADLVPEIADDIVAIDRAMRWGFNWKRGPFELIDALGPARFSAALTAAGKPVPAMLQVLQRAGARSFYRGDTYLARAGSYVALPGE
jgi:3-hydroxyacyl-CoA dehydrogenase